MKVYLAAQYARREELKAHADALQKIGIEITSHWVHETAAFVSGGPTGTANNSPEHVGEMAERDLADINRANILVLFTNGPETKIVRGAHHFEAGYAYGQGIEVITVGPRDNVFHYLPCVKNYPTWEDAYAKLQGDRKYEEEVLY